MNEKLAIHGGKKMIPDGMMKHWPPVTDADRKMVLSALDGGTHTVGPHYQALEKEFAQALVACECGCGDEAIVPAYTWPSSATCCLHHNVVPVFVDIEWSTMNIDPSKIEAAITPRTKAIIAVHLHGLSVDMDAVMAIAKKHKLKVIEDCCQAHGVKHNGKAVGTFGDCAAFSCNQNKIMCSGEGGFFCSNDAATFERGKTLWYFGEHRRPDSGSQHNAYGMGWMYRSSELVAAFARTQLARVDDYLAQMQVNAKRLTECLEGTPNLILPVTPPNHGHNFYNYTIRFDMAALGHENDPATFRNKLVKALQAEGVDTSVWQSWAVPEMTAIQAKDAYGRGCPWRCSESQVDYSLEQFPMSVKHSGWHTGMTTPLRPDNTPEFAELVAAGIRKVLANIDQVETIE